ncbi:5-methyltetrahydropteroyltriglutamate--homocysteine S-methyltransferase [Sphingopyxis macrogoltabida]|uniref:5-methyltetrahydropteroyltriglutamate--homocysteine methyltransferase n=1 Tax=Sphingopyxis macrogoltabida TaxID=33050 RepID=A0A0N9UCA0_SPHMC|nr:5-methyltetrahydropteroyltriglutamate--homocysteine S-methyltransferase [Sphingopyxis macrogoltabida]ALH80974.1 5-methyltetrahydropteroyltriglutamate-- homocysteine methyltransferase [Sphingopyxis macrogoltabida]
MTVRVATLGFPRIGPRRELKHALESYWAGKSSLADLRAAAAGLRASAWARQKALGADILPSNDFSLYDHVLDTSALIGAVPRRYDWDGDTVDPDLYFAMARGSQADAGHAGCTHAAADTTAMEMTKWFDTNYHFLVPELTAGQTFRIASTKIFDEYEEAKALGYPTRPVLLGPVSYLMLAKGKAVEPLALLPQLLDTYAEILGRLAGAGAEWVQIDEPCLVLDLTDEQRTAFERAYARLATSGPKLMLTTYFGGLGDNLDLVAGLPVHGLHLDLVRAPGQLEPALQKLPPHVLLSLGVIDGRNVWRANLPDLYWRLKDLAGRRDLILAPSCSLLHVPVDLALETALDPEIAQWLSFAVQKIEELAALAKALNEGEDASFAAFSASRIAAVARQTSPKIHDPAVAARLAALDENAARRTSPFAARREVQQARLSLPAYPTTTIGSFPQTPEVRKARAAHLKGEIDDAAYARYLRTETRAAIRWQEEIGLDVLVHGEFERNDMVQYFGEQLAGFAFTRAGWVQSYGSRCVRPPILYGDVSRPAPMTVDWWRYAQEQTERPMKGMLTGPVTILNWSFVRDDQPREQSCRQIALAIRDEVQDLETAGAAIIQIDEAALREGLPLRRGEWQHYLDWAVESFRIAASGVRDDTQIHTHMCYSEFNDIIRAIGAMDADVISIETARSQMELLGAFATYVYPNEVGPGVYDIHSPRIPAVSEMADLLTLAGKHVPSQQIWVNPDCGLKTRKWEEVRPALIAMVAAAQAMRANSSVRQADAVG